MDYITEWVTGIVVFLILAILLELLLPSTSLQRYVRLCLSLTLMVMIMQPLFELFNKGPEHLSDMFHSYESTHQPEIESVINQQKSEIESRQDAYISEQVSVQLKKEAEAEVKERWNMNVVEVSVVAPLADEQVYHDEEPDVSVMLEPVNEEEGEESDIERIETVKIETTRPPPTRQGGEETVVAEIKQFLSERWEIDDDRIELQIEGGAEA